MPDVILASQSPRRKQLLKNLIDDFLIIPSDADETLPEGLMPAECAMEIARRKVFDIKQGHPESLIIGADTIVVYDDKILGKPKDRDDAFNMLTFLSGKTHKVYTGLVVSLGDKTLSFAEETRVTFRTLSEEMIKNYIQTGSFPTENAIRAENYTAQEIAAMAPRLKDVGIYVFLISLREDPVGAKEVIAEGFMRK